MRIALAMIFRKIPTTVNVTTLPKSICQTSGGLTPCIQTRNTADAAISSKAMKKGLSIINIGVISKNAMNVTAGLSGLFWEITQPNRNSREMDR